MKTRQAPYVLFLFLMLNVFVLSGQTSADVLFNEAEKLAEDRAYELSNQKYNEALPLFLSSKNWPKYYQARYAITYNYLDLYDFEAAKKEVNDAITHFEKNYHDTFTIWQPKLYHAAGQVYLDVHNYNLAIANNRLAMKYYQNIIDEKERKKYTAFMFNNIGAAYKLERSMDSAMFYFNKALPLKQESIGPNAASTLRTIKAISGIYQDWGMLDNAIETQSIALNGALAEGNRNAEAQAYNGLSQMYQRKRDFETSKKYISKAMEIYKGMSSDFKMDVAHSYHQMGNVLETEKAHKESLDWYMTAKRMYREIHNGKASYQEGNSTMNLGKAHNYMAQELEQSAPEYDMNHPEVKALRAKAITYYEENEAIFTEAVGKDHARFIELWLSKGVCLIENGDTLAAHNLFQKAYNRSYKLAPEKSYDRSLSCLSLARTTEDTDRAMVLYQQGLWELSNGWEPAHNGDNPSAQESFFEDWSVEIMLMKSKRFLDLYHSDNNNQYLRDGISTMVAADELLQESRASYLTTSAKISLGKRGHEIYANGVELCYNLGSQESQAFDFFEKSRGLVLLEALHLGNNTRSMMVPDSLMSRIRRLDNQIDELKLKQNDFKESERLSELGVFIFDLEKDRETLEQKINDKYPIAERITSDGLVVDLETVQKSLHENEVVYEYLDTKRELYILKIEKNKSKLYKVLNDVYEKSLDTLLVLINDQNIAKNKSNSKEIWDQYQRLGYKIFENILPDYNNEDLLIIPDGQLNYLPFELLLTEEKVIDQINYGLLPYLLKSGVIKYAFSSSLHYAQLDLIQKDQNSLLAMAPTYPASPTGLLASRDGFTALKYTEREATDISNIMGGQTSIGSQATVSEFKNQASDFKILHLAMHAYTHDTDPMLSGMVFTDTDDKADHVLHAYELYNMDIPSEMVVLSACNTGLGQHEKGEGVMSLGRAFRHAGTKNVIMSLWQADDETTREIMTNFYTNLKDGQPKAEALRNAKLSYLDTGANLFPHFWGSFVLLGDDNVLEIGTSTSMLIWAMVGLLFFLIIGLIFKNYSILRG